MSRNIRVQQATNRAKTCQVVSHESWISDTILQALAGNQQTPESPESPESPATRPETDWQLETSSGLAPLPSLGSADALWIAPGLLIAHNAWLRAQGLEPIRLPAPSPNWLADLAQGAPELARRAVVVASTQEIRSWGQMPAGLGERPWSQLAQGRVSAFRAARRPLAQLQADLASAPADSLIQVSGQVDGISEEWRVVVSQGQPAAASGYCIHSPAGSQQILSVFDGATFDPIHREQALAAASQAARTTGLNFGAVDLAFVEAGPGAAASEGPVVLEANPLWCAAPYDYGRQGMRNFLQALKASEAGLVGVDQSTSAAGAGGGAEGLYRQDTWMVAEFSRRYAGYLNRP
ncbi:hypothetical protein KIM372_02620 [Bombiscardovia nodaiensis]|uniref:ATP-grasp domain-containing protein n=1 Tax=Bombiscardovia nodaiensis TaxID=2932181 RepID=A0ABM8B6F6_9BIFI|nr:hypothetical protein KIM372_02620 [Bombiscardovia nodaiensis]